MAKLLTRRLQRNNRDHYTLTVPKHLVQLLKWDEGDLIEFGIDKGVVSIKKNSL